MGGRHGKVRNRHLNFESGCNAQVLRQRPWVSPCELGVLVCWGHSVPFTSVVCRGGGAASVRCWPRSCRRARASARISSSPTAPALRMTRWIWCGSLWRRASDSASLYRVCAPRRSPAADSVSAEDRLDGRPLRGRSLSRPRTRLCQLRRHGRASGSHQPPHAHLSQGEGGEEDPAGPRCVHQSLGGDYAIVKQACVALLSRRAGEQDQSLTAFLVVLGEFGCLSQPRNGGPAATRLSQFVAVHPQH